MADYNLKDDLLGFGRSQLKYMLFHNTTLSALTAYTYRKGLFFYDTDNDSLEVIHDSTSDWRTTLNIISKNNPLYDVNIDPTNRLLVGSTAYGSVEGYNPTTGGFVTVDADGLPSTQQYVRFEDIEPTDYTTVITAPGVDTRFTTEKAIVDYVSTLTNYWRRTSTTLSPLTSNDNVSITTTGSIISLLLSSVDGNTIQATSTNGVPLYGSSITGSGGQFLSTSNYAIRGEINNSNTNGVSSSMLLQRRTSGLAASGIGTSIRMDIENASGIPTQALELIGLFTNCISGSEISDFVVKVRNVSSTLVEVLRASNVGLLTVPSINLSSGTALKYLYLDANKNITYVDAPSGSNPISVTDGIFDLDLTGDVLTVSPFASVANDVFYNTPIVDINSDPPTSVLTVLNYNGAFRTPLLYEGNKRVMTVHGVQLSDGTFHTVSDQFNAGFMPALPTENGNTKYMRGDGTWQVITSGGTVNPLSVTDGIFDLDVTADILTVTPYASKTASALYTGATVPTLVATYLNYDGVFRATQLYEGSTRVMTTHGAWTANGTLHAVANTSHAGFCPQLTGSTANFLRADGIWATMTFTEVDTLQTVANRGSVSTIILTYNESKTFTNPYSLVTKEYVDAIAAGTIPKLPVDAATTANITLSGTQTIDGYSATAGKRVLVKNQVTQSANGIYTVAAGAWTREADSDTWAELYRGYYVVLNGTANGGSSYVCSIGVTGTVGVNDITFSLYSTPAVIVGGDGLTKTGSTLSVNVDTTTIEITSDVLNVKANVFQAYDLDLVAIAGLSGTSGVLKKTAANTWTLDTNAYITGDVVTSFNTRTGVVVLTKADVEAVLTGLITSHTHSYLPLSGGTITGNLTVNGTTTLNAVTKKGTTMIPNLNADLLDGYHATAFSLYHTHPYLPLTGGTISGNLIVSSTTTLNAVTKNGTTMIGNLNADLLDGNHASAFALASHTHPYQPLDTDLTLIAALTGGGILKRYADDGTWELDNTAYLTGNKVTSFNGRINVVTLLKSDVEAVLTGDIYTHTHPAYDYYNHWKLYVNSVLMDPITSAYQLNFLSGTGISITADDVNNRLTFTNLSPFPGFGTSHSTTAYGDHTHSIYVPFTGGTMKGALKARATVGTTTEVANVRYGTGTAPTITTDIPNGTIYIRYTA